MAFLTYIQPQPNGSMKSIPLNAYPEDAWRSIFAGYGDTSDVFAFYKLIPWLYRGVELRASSLANMPMAWEYNGDELEDEQARLPFAFNQRDVLNRLEGYLTLYGHAYLLKSSNAARFVREVRPLHPSTMKPRYDESTGELLGFTRSLKGAQTELTLEEVVYIWRPARDSENGHGIGNVEAALAAAGVLSNSDKFLDAYLNQSPIAPTLVSVEGMPAPSEMEKLQSWLERTLVGIKNAFRPIALRSSLKVDQLQPMDLSKLSLETMNEGKREDIATALGIPLSMLMSNAANYATAQQDTFNFYDNTIEPEAKLIAEALNDQLFAGLGYMLIPHKDRMQAYQEAEGQRTINKLAPLLDRNVITVDEARAELSMTPFNEADGTDSVGNEAFTEGLRSAKGVDVFGYHLQYGVVSRNEARSALGLPPVDESNEIALRNANQKLQTVKQAVDAGIPLEAALRLAGLAVPGFDAEAEAQRRADEAAALAEARAQNVQQGNQQPPQPEPDEDDSEDTDEDDTAAMQKSLAALGQWESKAIKRVGHNNYGKALLFDSADIPLFARAFVEAKLPTCKSPTDVRTLFSGAREWVNYP